jgi:uncharacterized protein YfaS (alpha-2-macroglobulin family)
MLVAGVPCCRLVYIVPSRSILVNVTADRASYAPRGKVTLTVHTRDGRTGLPLPSTVGLSVVDSTVLQVRVVHVC